MNHKPARSALLIATSFTLPALAFPAFAQESHADKDMIIVTAQRENQTGVSQGGSAGVLGDKSAEDLPFSVRSYNSALILNQQPQTLGQVLENDPTIRTTTGFGIAGELFNIRGFTLGGDDIGYDGLYGIMPRQLAAPELYESVEVLNGSSAFLNGAAPGGSGIGGSVNLIPKRANDRDTTRATLGYTASEHVGGSFDIGHRLGDDGEWGIRVNGAVRSGDVSIDDEFRSTNVLGGAVDYNSGPLRLSLDIAYQRIKVAHFRPKLRVSGLGVIPDEPDASTNFGQPWQYTTLRDVFGQFRAEYDIADNVMVYAAFGARDGSEAGVYSTPTLIDATTGDISVSSSYIPRTDNNEAATAGLRARFETEGISNEINFGGSINWLVNRNAYEFYTASPELNNLYDPITVTRSSTISFAGGDLDDPFPISRTRLRSAFISDTVGFWDDRVMFTAGVRLQEIRSKSYSAFTEALTGEYKEDAWTPVFGLVVKPVDGLSLYANRIESLVQGGSAPVSGADPSGGAALPVSNAGEVLSPYVSEQYEIGGKLSLDPVDMTLALFQIDRETAILRVDPADSTMLEFGPFGIQRNRGIEFTLAGEIRKGLRLIAGGSVIDAKLRQTQNGINEGNDAVGVPEFLLNANIEWDVPFAPALTLTGRVVHTGKQPADIANTLFLDSWTRFDIGARYVALVGDNPLTLRLSVDNVANEAYWASAFDSFRPDLALGTPRTLKASATIDF
ncbi:TonB-dependent receptor [uncultured Parasphingorhabdus sp.]|uniref:TonB-dependent receptor n=1 Tax=uncultured Parasphingorhabdus sp. TaxID=2709694 RepID=UPI0030D85578|tara:strand:- start:64095 stop:66290 length:2196 start_codon:yes stop_codon:yes gene_type:complete